MQIIQMVRNSVIRNWLFPNQRTYHVFVFFQTFTIPVIKIIKKPAWPDLLKETQITVETFSETFPQKFQLAER